MLNLYTLAVYFFAPSDALSKQCKAFKRIATKLQSVWAEVNEMDTMRTYVRCSFGSWFWFGYDTVRLKKNIHIHILCMLYYSGFSALSFKTNWNFTIPRLPSICIRNHPKPYNIAISFLYCYGVADELLGCCDWTIVPTLWFSSQWRSHSMLRLCRKWRFSEQIQIAGNWRKILYHISKLNRAHIHFLFSIHKHSLCTHLQRIP